MQQLTWGFIGLLKALISFRTFRSADRRQQVPAHSLEDSETARGDGSGWSERDVEDTMRFLRAQDERLACKPSRGGDDLSALDFDADSRY
jgi:hypothetical protein